MSDSTSESVITDLSIHFYPPRDESSSPLTAGDQWHRVGRDLYLDCAPQTAWLCVTRKKEIDLTTDDLVVTSTGTGRRPSNLIHWESRAGSLWVLRSPWSGNVKDCVTKVDVLFGTDAVDPRPQHVLALDPLQLEPSYDLAPPYITTRFGRNPKPDLPKRTLKAKEDGTFKIVQISDTHMATGPGVCDDAIDANGNRLPKSRADPLTVDFIERIVDVERPDLVILTGDQVSGNVDTQTSLLKLLAPVIRRSIPWVLVFGNHDDEGSWSRAEQMDFLQSLPFSLCEPGPANVDGVGNYVLQIYLSTSPSQPLATLFLLDSHGQIKREGQTEYDWIKQSQIDWFTSTSRELRKERNGTENASKHVDMAFLHIPLPEYGHPSLLKVGGHRGEDIESPKFNSHLYDALVTEGVVVLSCGHDHVNDYCGLLPKKRSAPSPGPWLCYNGGTGFGAYGSWGGKFFHRRTRVWELDEMGGVKTWKRVEYAADRVDEVVLVRDGKVVEPRT